LKGLMMAMTIFMGYPRLRPLPAGAGCGQSSLSAGARSIAARANATPTNQAPCQFAAAALSAWKQMQFAEKPEEDCDPLPGPAQIPPKVAYLLGSDYAGIACLRPGQSRPSGHRTARGVRTPREGLSRRPRPARPGPRARAGFGLATLRGRLRPPYCSASPCWVRSRPSISCCSLTRSGTKNAITLSRI
jgi:hypothetical protein